jgi:hypothetical protein
LIALSFKISDDDSDRFANNATAINCESEISTEHQARLVEIEEFITGEIDGDLLFMKFATGR